VAKQAKWCNYMDAESHQKINLNAFLGSIVKIYDVTNMPEQIFFQISKIHLF
jgi:hypothetical protein